MVVYIDLIIIATCIVNYSFIKTINILFHHSTSFIRMFLALLLSVVSLVLYLLPYNYFFIIRYFIGIFIGIIAFNHQNKKIKIIKIVLFYILNMTFIGTLVVFKIKNFILMLITMLYVIILYIIEHYQVIFKEDYYEIKIKKKSIIAFLDTGNTTQFENIPIIFLKEKYRNNDFIYITTIKIKTICGINQIKIYNGPLITIKHQQFKVYYAFDKNLNYDGLLNNLMKENLK